MYNIIINSDIKIVESNLAPFIVNNFYCNYLSGNYMDNNLLYILALLLKDEIDNLNNVNQINNFLNNTKCGFLLEQLLKMPDIHIYFKNIVYNTIEKLERSCAFREFNLNVIKILKIIQKIKDSEDKKISKKYEKDLDENYKKVIDNKILDPSINYSKEENLKNHNKNHEIFMEKYVAAINSQVFEERAEKAKNENKNILYEYFKNLENDINSSKNKELYSNSNLMDKMIKTKMAAYMLLFYQNDFLQIISLLNELIGDLINNMLLLPNSIKYICKIISILLKNKFKDIRKEEENAFISKFIIEKLLIPIFSSPTKIALISDFVISGNTIKNIHFISIILKKLFSGKLFLNDSKEGDYTPFNWLFMDKIEKVFDFFENSISVNLPNFIELLINNQLPKDYSYDFFNENNDEICANISICFTIDNLFNLVNGLKNSSSLLQTNFPKIIKLKRSFSKLISEKNIMNIKEIDNKAKSDYIESLQKNQNKKEQIKDFDNFYLYNDLIIEKKYENLFSINNQIANFYINLKKIEKNKSLNEEEKNIIKIKNYLCSSLGNFRLINKSDFNIRKNSDTKKLLEEIKAYMSLSNFTLNNNTIPSIWYINSILNYLDIIPQDYKENEYQKLFNELSKELNESINSLDFEKLILFRNKVKFLEQMTNYYDNVRKLINNIIINEQIKEIAETKFIPIDIIFEYDNEENQFELVKSSVKEKIFEDKIIYEDPKKKIISFKTIEAFTRYFPNLTKYQYNQDISPIEIMQELHINDKINNYFEIIKNKIKKHNMLESIERYTQLYEEKIKDYIMDKLYDKIYPPEPHIIDIKIYQKTEQISWVDPQLLINKDYIFDNMLPEILNEFKQINKFKTPYKKLNSIRNIMKYIENLIHFNEGIDKEIGAEDVTPVLNYIFIKAHPDRIYTDIEFIKLFIENSGQYENALINFQSMCDVIVNCNEKSFNLTLEEFQKKCANQLNGNH